MLGWSINLFRVFGIRLAMHFSFLLLLAYVAWSGWADSGWAGVAWSLAFVAMLFTCIVMHELGHSLTARRFGINVRRILLLPIGGMAEFDTIPREPRLELLVTLAGPAVNFAVVVLLWAFVTPPPGGLLGEVSLNFAGFRDSLWLINLIMGCFNLLPVFPMDGGRILRSLLAMRWPYLQATFWAATVGKVLAVAGIVLMLVRWHNPLGAVLFAFILLVGELEYRAVKRREEAHARWEVMLRRVYGVPAGSAGEARIELLHGPN